MSRKIADLSILLLGEKKNCYTIEKSSPFLSHFFPAKSDLLFYFSTFFLSSCCSLTEEGREETFLSLTDNGVAQLLKFIISTTRKKKASTDYDGRW